MRCVGDDVTDTVVGARTETLRHGEFALEDLPTAPTVIMVTAYDREDLLRQAQVAEFDGLLIKPISASTLSRSRSPWPVPIPA